MAEFITIKHCVMKLYSCEFHCIMYNDINLSGEQLNKPKMAYSRDLLKMAGEQCGIMD